MQDFDERSSYIDNGTEIAIVRGHDDTKYMIGGNAEFNIKDKISLYKQSLGNIQDVILISLFDDMFPYLSIKTKSDVDDKLKYIENVDNDELIEILENSLQLNESIIIQLRRLFYIFLDLEKDNPKYDKDLKTKLFCHKNPNKCIAQIIIASSLDFISEYNGDAVLAILSELESMLKIRNTIREKVNTKMLKYDSLESFLESLVKNYETNYEIFKTIEEENIDISKKIEELSDLLSI